MAPLDLIPQLEAELRQCESDAAALRQVLVVLRRRAGVATAAPRSATPRAAGRTPAMILSIMAEADEPIWTAPAMTQALQARGWSTPQADATNAVRTAMARLAQRGDLVRSERPGEYRLPQRPESERPDGTSLNGSSEPREEAMT